MDPIGCTYHAARGRVLRDTRQVRALTIALFTAGCISPVMHFGPGKTAKQAQHDTMAEFGPAHLVTGETWSGEVTTVKLRVWADSEYRTQNIHWQDTFEQPLELANLVLTPLFGVHMVAEYAVWDRDVPSATLTDDIVALEELDPGKDVFAVVGLTSSLPLVSATFDELGIAALRGRHVMLRGYADLEERKGYATAFPELRSEERQLALVQLRQHKTAVVLLHELGHVLGAEHETEEETIMSAAYSSHAASFSTSARDVMRRSIDQRLHRTPPPPPSDAPTATADAQHALSSEVMTPAPVVPAVHHEPVVIRVTRKRTTIVDGKTLDATSLDAMLTEVLSQDRRTKLVISEDRNVPTGAVGDLLDHLRALGFTKFEMSWSGK
jgi:biopolymer transport protein ExbD